MISTIHIHNIAEAMIPLMNFSPIKCVLHAEVENWSHRIIVLTMPLRLTIEVMVALITMCIHNGAVITHQIGLKLLKIAVLAVVVTNSQQPVTAVIVAAKT